MGKKTALYNSHNEAGGKMVDFAGWDMPLHYGSQIQEHHAVRRDSGMFDVSHMTVIDFDSKAKGFLCRLLANNIAPLPEGKALYGCMLNEQGGVIDDLIVYVTDFGYRMVVNAATRDKDLAWIQKQAQSDGVDVNERADLSMIAVQGPQARENVHSCLSDDERAQVGALKRFQACSLPGLFVARTGYTGEDGYELMIDHDRAVSLWQQLTQAGVTPVGLGARDTLRLEAGMHLYGQDMDENTTPLEAGLAWTVAFEPGDRDFIGRKALEDQKIRGVEKKLIGLLLRDKGVLRHGQTVLYQDQPRGEITSGSFSPTLQRSIALASVANEVEQTCQIEVRGKKLNADVVKPPFVRNGKICIDLD